jgi:putative cardiolipin synthase
LDGRSIFVGSFNMDPRSSLLNTEMGLVIDSPTLATRLGEAFDRNVPLLAYEVRLAPGSDELQWVERTPTGQLLHDSEPGSGAWARFKVKLLSLLPIEWLL